MIYLDSAAATKPLPCAIDSMNMVLREAWANPNSVHEAGRKAAAVVEAAKHTVARCLDCAPEEVNFCGSSSEAAAWVKKTFTENAMEMRTLNTEHDAVYNAPINGVLAEAYCKPKAHFRMLVNNETGYIYNVAEFAREHPCDFVATDATAAVGNIPVSFRNLDVDYLFCDALKFGGVPGCGILLVKDGAPISTLMHRPTPPAALIAACAAALEWSVEHMVKNESHMRRLAGILFSYALNNIPKTHINGDVNSGHAPHVYSIRFDGVENTALELLLSRGGVMVSAGAACSSGNNEPSRVLMASGLTEQQARETIRISFGHDTTEHDAKRAGEIIAECVKQLRGMSA